jgi:hypothetical protein
MLGEAETSSRLTRATVESLGSFILLSSPLIVNSRGSLTLISGDSWDSHSGDSRHSPPPQIACVWNTIHTFTATWLIMRMSFLVVVSSLGTEKEIG